MSLCVEWQRCPNSELTGPGVTLLLEKEECQQSVYFMGLLHEARVAIPPRGGAFTPHVLGVDLKNTRDPSAVIVYVYVCRKSQMRQITAVVDIYLQRTINHSSVRA